MTASIPLPGLRADSPAAALALYGIAHLLAPDVSVRWTSQRDSEWHAEVSSARCPDFDGLVEALTEAIGSDPLTDVQSIAKDVNELTPQTWSRALSSRKRGRTTGRGSVRGSSAADRRSSLHHACVRVLVWDPGHTLRQRRQARRCSSNGRASSTPAEAMDAEKGLQHARP